MLALLLLCFVLLTLWLLWSLLGVILPVRPFRSRGRATKSALASFALSMAAAVAIGVVADKDGPAAAPPNGKEAASGDESVSALQKTVAVAGSLPVPCGEGGAAFGDIYAVTGDHELRSAPSSDADRITNEKASAILGETHYHRIDTSVTVRRLCVQAEWTEVRIVTPEWLAHVTGWVPNEALRPIERSADGARIYVEQDFLWDEDTSRHKAAIVAVVNRIARENSSCGKIDPATVARSPSRSKPADPVFFVTCGEGLDAFNVWFRPADAAAAKKFAAVQPLDRAPATEACERAARNAATHPSTVDFSRLWGLAYVPHASGRATVLSSFTAKNAFGLELKDRISRLFEGPELIETQISEAAD